MPHTVQLDLKAEDFRQNYTPEVAEVPVARHWMLDFAPGRDLLKTKLSKFDSNVKVPIWKKADNLDGKLNRMVDELGLRGMEKPVTAMEQLKATAKFFMLMLKVEFNRV